MTTQAALTLPNQITILRIILCAPYFICLHYNLIEVAIALFSIIVISDVLDGIIARKLGQVTEAGAVLDPLADKVAVIGSFIYFLSLKPMSLIVAPWMVIIIVMRELFITELRNSGKLSAANFMGKIKTASQNSCIILLLILVFFPSLEVFLSIIVSITVFLTILSGLIYLRQTIKVGT